MQIRRGRCAVRVAAAGGPGTARTSAPTAAVPATRVRVVAITCEAILARVARQWRSFAAIGSSYSFHATASSGSIAFAVVRGRRQVQRLLELTGMSEHLTLIDDPDEVLSAD
jgi:hypothetical protein